MRSQPWRFLFSLGLGICSFPLATIVVLLAAKYKTMEAESASALLPSTLSLVITVPIIIAIRR